MGKQNCYDDTQSKQDKTKGSAILNNVQNAKEELKGSKQCQ